MTTTVLVKPPAGRKAAVHILGAKLDLHFPMHEVTLEHPDQTDSLRLNFNDGSSLELRGFYNRFGSKNLPDFVVDGQPQSGSEFFSAFAPDLTPVGEPPHHLRNCRWNDFHDFGPDLMESVDHLEACQTIFRHEPDTPVSSPMPEAAEHTLEQGFLLFGAQKPAARVLPSANTETQADVSPDEEMVSLTDAKDLETDFSQTLPAEMAEAATPLNEENGAVTTADMEALLSVEVPIPPDASGETGMAANMVVLETS